MINCFVCMEFEIWMILYLENFFFFYNKVIEDMSLYNGVFVYSINEVKNFE